MPQRTRTCEPPPYESHRQPPPKSGQEGNATPRNHSSKKRSCNSKSGPSSKKGRTDHEESSRGRKRSTSSRPSDSTCQEPPKARRQQQQRPVYHATLSEKEIKQWLTLVTDENLSRRQRREHALHFLGATHSTKVTLQYRTLSLHLHPDKNSSDALANFSTLGRMMSSMMSYPTFSPKTLSTAPHCAIRA